jgi:hypothetical protein
MASSIRVDWIITRERLRPFFSLSPFLFYIGDHVLGFLGKETAPPNIGKVRNKNELAQPPPYNNV